MWLQFLRVHMQRTAEHANLYLGFLFFALLVMLFNGLSEITFTVRNPPAAMSGVRSA